MASFYKIMVFVSFLFLIGCTENRSKIKSIRSTLYKINGKLIKISRDDSFNYYPETMIIRWNECEEYDFFKIFDRKGNLIKKYEFRWLNGREDTISMMSYFYDKNNNIVRKVEMNNWLSERKIYTHAEYSYIENKIFEECYMDSIVRKDSKSIIDSLMEINMNLYDEKHRLIKSEGYQAVYENELLIEERDNSEYIVKYKYNEKGKRTDEQLYKNSNALAVGFKYYYHANITEELFYKDNRPLARQTFKYNDTLLIQKIIYKGISDIVYMWYDFEYDKNNNLIRKIAWRESIDYIGTIDSMKKYLPEYMIEREIEYY